MTHTVSRSPDVIDAILGVEPGTRIADIRGQFPQNQLDFQAYYDALFNPNETSEAELSVAHRLVIAIRVASHTGSTAVADWYIGEARNHGVSDEIIDHVRGLESPDTGVPVLDAALRHTDLLVTHPVDASKQDLQALEIAGLRPGGIVTLSQVAAFVSYQLRFVALIRAVGDLS